ncbi:MAG TPA: putative glycoside hydrolase [Spirochaetota bacterium]|nr:putative glycoside hydrolase [Spirochaetota bacterium]HPP94069.1 putative glycoside hydrolase [Spirochaetota bacterium]
MKKRIFLISAAAVVVLLLVGGWIFNFTNATNTPNKAENAVAETQKEREYSYPSFYKGIYLTVDSALNFQKLKGFVEKAKMADLNTLVIDVQSSKFAKCIVPAEHVQYVKDNGLHPVARIVIFPDGLKEWPVSEEYIKDKIDIAESACKNGFKEIQFDYIRFNDSNKNKHVTIKERYAFIENFILRVKKELKAYNVRYQADIFGRIPLNQDDLIGQKMESMDKVVDIICPMAYPSHYTWSKKLMKDPYFTVLQTSKKAKERAKNAQIVTWIQAFRMKLYDIPYEKYIEDQLRAVYESDIKGFYMWNARQDYEVPIKVVINFNNKKSNIAKN